MQTSPTRGPTRWMTVFIAVVVPCTSSVVSPRKASTLAPSWAAIASSPTCTAAIESSGVDSSFQLRTTRSPSITTKSVKVPPTSIPTR